MRTITSFRRYHMGWVNFATTEVKQMRENTYVHTVLYCKMSRFGQLLKWSNIIYFAFVCSVEASNRMERVWPVNGSSSVDLPQSSPFGPRLQISENRR